MDSFQMWVDLKIRRNNESVFSQENRVLWSILTISVMWSLNHQSRKLKTIDIMKTLYKGPNFTNRFKYYPLK